VDVVQEVEKEEEIQEKWKRDGSDPHRGFGYKV